MNEFRAKPQRRHLATSPFKPPAPPEPVEIFTVNDQVTHDKYGLGVVLSVSWKTKPCWWISGNGGCELRPLTQR